MIFLNQTIKLKLLTVLTIFTIAIISIIGINKYNIESIAIGSDTYKQIINSKDLIADILPPPAYIIEARLVTYQLLDANNLNETKLYMNKLAQLEKDIQSRHKYWQQNLQNESLMKQFTPVYETAMAYFAKVNNELLPLLKHNNKELAYKLVKGDLEEIYLKHRHYVDILVLSSAKEGKIIEESSSNKLDNTKIITILSGLTFIIIAILLTSFIVNNIVTTLSRLQIGLISFFSFLNKEKDYTDLIEIHSNDEFGQMAKTINQNIIKTQKLAKEFERTSKLASMGEMLENIAHQWKQPLSGITALSSGVLAQIELNLPITPHNLGENMNKILDYSNYMNQTINDFRNFLKEQKHKELFSVSDTVKQSLNIVHGDLNKASITIIQNLDNNVKFFGCQSELMQVIINILNNAKDAMIENNIEDKTIIIEVLCDNGTVIITIEDNGRGIPQDIIDNIFDSHFTTKAEKGTGIGLYMSKQIIHNSFNGELSVQNINHGAKFTIKLKNQNDF